MTRTVNPRTAKFKPNKGAKFMPNRHQPKSRPTTQPHNVLKLREQLAKLREQQ